jgi:glycosyltransferase involved in cell wall biosynthesis
MKKSVYMLTSATLVNGTPDFSPFVAVQARYVEQTGWRVAVGLVDDRTTVAGVLRNLRRMFREIGADPPGVVHAQYGSMLALIAALVKGKAPLVVSFGGADLVGSKNPGIGWFVRDSVGRWFSLFAAYRSAVVVVKSENLYRSLPRILQAKTLILPNGVDTEVFRPLDKAECRARLNWPLATKIVLFNASKADNQIVKNPALARASVDFARTRFPASEFRQISDLPHSEVAVMMNAGDCLLLTSLSEGSPNIVKEAMACNLPVVSVPCGDVVDRTKHTFPGAICAYDSRALGEALIKVFASPQRSNGREQLEIQGLNGRQVAEKLLKVYSIVQGPSHEIKQKLPSLYSLRRIAG